MLAEEVRTFAIVPTSTTPNIKPRTAGRDRALKSWRLTRDAEKADHEARQRTGACYKRGEAEHGVRQCPHTAFAEIAMRIKRDDIEHAAAQVALYKAQYVLMTTDYALFAPEEVIFDAAASKSVFKNPNFLTDIAQSNSPDMIGCVQQGAPGVRIDNVGNFRDLGEVGIGKGAACNIFPVCKVLDTGRT